MASHRYPSAPTYYSQNATASQRALTYQDRGGTNVDQPWGKTTDPTTLARGNLASNNVSVVQREQSLSHAHDRAYRGRSTSRSRDAYRDDSSDEADETEIETEIGPMAANRPRGSPHNDSRRNHPYPHLTSQASQPPPYTTPFQIFPSSDSGNDAYNFSCLTDVLDEIPLYEDKDPGRRVRLWRFERSQTLVLDLTDRISSRSSEYVNTGGHCDLYSGYLRNDAGSSPQLHVALKRMRLKHGDSNLMQFFMNEMEIWSKIQHPHILTFLGIYRENKDIYYLVSPYQRYGDMSHYLLTHPNEDPLRLLKEVAYALTYLHLYGFLHGDIKGANVLVSDTGRALLCDFGLSIVLDRYQTVTGNLHSPTDAHIGGTLRFMAPELGSIDSKKTAESDTFAFAMLIIESYTKREPFAHLTHSPQVVLALSNGDRPPKPNAFINSDIGEAMWRLTEVCWNQQPEKRPSMRLVATMLSQLWLKAEKRTFQLELFDHVMYGKPQANVITGASASNRYREPTHNYTTSHVQSVVAPGPSHQLARNPSTSMPNDMTSGHRPFASERYPTAGNFRPSPSSHQQAPRASRK